ncbi:DNA recombination protein RmuC [Candidatus Arsenophonus lipoptenae]|uniref:DNA recombination protein RmuC n=1 Tax=Candidatus Arsenophonus lipoptenae TaxID=634113 RepID=A0A0X9VJ85_9GAMM|nr:DNA recombination protein RmuC [Candidatus Arsenophonus lipoptenae]AMA65065.1 DNA recombination protein RmuC [Candidatus Arsenophonus lipoptenae]
MDIQLLCIMIMIGFLIGILFGSSIVWLFIAKKINIKNHELHNLHRIQAIYEEKISHLEYWKYKCEQRDQELRLQRDINHNQEIELREVITRFEETRLAFEEKQNLLLNSEQRLNIQFENLANRIFVQNEKRTSENNRQCLITLLTPFREQLDKFHRQIYESFNQESRERHILAHEIHQLQQLNSEIVKETIGLTKALKGDNKIQGNWGETILARILENSGLRKGYEFEIQVSIETSNSRYQPDVIIRLPQGRDVIIDSKMSLTAYEHYFNSEDEEQRIIALRSHINSVRNHIKKLGCKDYHKLNGLKSLDYVLMFIPLEPAYLITLREAPELIDEGLRNNVLLVCPSTLLVVIRTINNLWSYEKQNQNAKIIADRASKMYDKMRLFVEDIQILGQSLNKAQVNYQSAIKKLSEGKGNLISQAENLKELGIEVKRPIDTEVSKKIDK